VIYIILPFLAFSLLLGAICGILGFVCGKKWRLNTLICLKERNDRLQAELDNYGCIISYYRLMKLVSGAIKNTLHAHGEINLKNGLVGSAAKRVSKQIIGAVQNREGINDDSATR